MENLTVGLIGGSGMGQLLLQRYDGQRHDVKTPFGPPSDAIIETRIGAVRALCLSRHGPGHLLNPSQVPYRANIFALKQLGCTHILASGAVGSLRDDFRPRDLVIADQVIDKTFRRPGTFYDSAAVHVEFAEPFCPLLRQILNEAGAAIANTEPAFTVHRHGCYVCMEGPAFSTRAESLMHRLWGGDLIGMTAMPEAKLAREAEIAYALVALVTDYDCWRMKPQEGVAHDAIEPAVLLKEIIGNLEAATANAVRLMEKAIGLMEQRSTELTNSPALRALQLAIWSDKTRLPALEIERLGPLWKKYL